MNEVWGETRIFYRVYGVNMPFWYKGCYFLLNDFVRDNISREREAQFEVSEDESETDVENLRIFLKFVLFVLDVFILFNV